MDYQHMWCHEHQHTIDLTQFDTWTHGEYPCDRPRTEPAADADTSAYYTAPTGSAQHYTAYEAMYTADHGIGYPAADPQTSYEIDNAAELAAERYYGELHAQHETDTTSPFETPEPVTPPQPSTQLEAEPW